MYGTPHRSTTRSKLASLQANLRRLGEEVKQLLDLSERMLTKRWECQCLRQNRIRSLEKKFVAQAKHMGAATPRFRKEKTTGRQLERCHSVDLAQPRHLFLPHVARGIHHTDQFSRNNSVPNNKASVSQISQQSGKPENYPNMRNGEQPKVPVSDLPRLSQNEPALRCHNLRASERKSTTKTPRKSLDRPVLKLSPVKTYEKDQTDGSLDSEDRVLRKLILELNDDDDAITGLSGKTTIQFRFRGPSAKESKKTEPSTETVTTDNQFQAGNYLENQESCKTSVTARNSLRSSVKSTDLDPRRSSHAFLSEPIPRRKTQRPSGHELVRNRPYSIYSRPKSVKLEDKRGPCNCNRGDRNSTSWYNPILCNCAYEQEAANLSNFSDKGRNSVRSSTNLSHKQRGERGSKKTLLSYNRNSFKPDPQSSVVEAHFTPKRSLSMDTIEMLDAVEDPEVIDSISLHQLEREIRKADSTSPDTEDRPRSREVSSTTFREMVPVTETSQPASSQSPPTQSTYILPIYYPSILYCPVTQPTTCTGPWPQSCPQPIAPSNILIQSNPTTILSPSQTCPPPPVYGSYAMPTHSQTVLQQTVFLPNAFHMLSFQPM